MRFPRLMVEQPFTNEYDIIVCTLALLLRWFQQEDNLFAAQCIWWLASIIQYTEILKFHLQYNTYPSIYVKDLKVTPLICHIDKRDLIEETNIPELDLDHTSDTVEETPIPQLGSVLRNTHQKNLNTTRSGRVFKNKSTYREPSILELEQRFWKQSKQQRKSTRDRLWTEYKNMQ